MRDETRSALGEESRGTTAPLLYAGAVEKERFSRELAAYGNIPEEVIRFAFWGAGRHEHLPSPGATRNAILLQTAGSLILSVDDDTVCAPGRLPGSTRGASGLSLSGHMCPVEIWPFENHADAQAFMDPEQLDVLSEHSRFLGRSLAAITHHAGSDNVDLAPACSHIFESLLSGKGSIRLTFNGSVGDSGFYSGLGFLSHPSPATRARIHALNDRYNSAIASRQIARQTLLPNVLHANTGCVGMFFGLDNRVLPPPFIPTFNNEDGVFSALVAACSDDAYVSNISFSMVHHPPVARTYAETGVHRRVSDLVIASVSYWRPRPDEVTPVERLRSIGRYFVALGEMPSRHFRQWVNMLMCSQLALMIERFEHCLAEDQPDTRHSSRELIRQIEAAHALIECPDGLMPIDIARDTGEEQARETQAFLSQYGNLLIWWPAIWEGARALRSAGVEFGIPIGRCT